MFRYENVSFSFEKVFYGFVKQTFVKVFSVRCQNRSPALQRKKGEGDRDGFFLRHLPHTSLNNFSYGGNLLAQVRFIHNTVSYLKAGLVHSLSRQVLCKITSQG